LIYVAERGVLVCWLDLKDDNVDDLLALWNSARISRRELKQAAVDQGTSTWLLGKAVWTSWESAHKLGADVEHARVL
jgi:hypothetical protein